MEDRTGEAVGEHEGLLASGVPWSLMWESSSSGRVAAGRWSTAAFGDLRAAAPHPMCGTVGETW